MRIDSHFFKAIPRRERREYKRLKHAAGPARAAGAIRTGLSRVPWCGGIGPIAWRQAVGATAHWGGLLLALATPYVLACLPLIVFHDPKRVLLNVVGSLAFYSFLLLPTALKFDFRRDVDQIAILKSLPLRPAAVVTGQLAVPIFIAGAYQLAVLLTAELVYPVNPGLTDRRVRPPDTAEHPDLRTRQPDLPPLPLSPESRRPGSLPPHDTHLHRQSNPIHPGPRRHLPLDPGRQTNLRRLRRLQSPIEQRQDRLRHRRLVPAVPVCRSDVVVACGRVPAVRCESGYAGVGGGRIGRRRDAQRRRDCVTHCGIGLPRDKGQRYAFAVEPQT